MDLSVKKLAVGAVRLAAMSQFGPLAGGLFLVGGAVAGKVFAESEWAKTSSEMLMHLASDKASELFGSAAEGFRSGRNGDIEKSIQKAALEALTHLRAEAPAGFVDWFDDWHRYLTFKPAAEVFAGVPNLDPVAVNYDDERFRQLWWSRMEPVLASWRKIESSRITQLHLSSDNTLPEPLAAFLRERLPEALQEAHHQVLRDPELNRSWIAFQQHQFQASRDQWDRMERKLDSALGSLDSIHSRATPVWNIPAPILHYQDRPELVERIEQAMERGSPSVTALHGLGGIGKTQLVRGLAQRRRERYKLGAWVEAETTVSLLASLSALAPLLGLPPEQDQQALALRVMNELSHREPWLVIFDNAVSAEMLRPYVERLSGNGHVLITSRNEHWHGLAATVSVTQWGTEESADFLLKRTGQSDRATAKGLAEDLDGLVLALEHAAAYMLAGDGMTLAEYRRVWREKLKWIAKGHAYSDSVAAALGLSIDAVFKESRAAYDLLCLIAWFAPSRIPRKELLEAGASELPDELGRSFADRDEWSEVITTLGRYSLLTRERADGMVTGYSLHRVVQQVVRDRQAADALEMQWLTVACDVVNAAFAFDPGEPEHWAASEALLPHARAIRGHVRDRAVPASVGRLLNEAGIYLRVRGLYREAGDFLELALELAVRELPDHPHVAVYRSNLANILGSLAEHAEARKQIEQALESDLRQFGPDHPNVAGHRSNLANILSDLGEHAEARKQIELALESALRQLGPDHPNVAVHRSSMAKILGSLGEHAEARKQIELALESALRQFGPDHPTVAVHRSILANILSDLGEHAEARKQIELALESALRQFGPDHPNVAVRRSNLAVILRALGEPAEARKQIELALASDLRQFGPDHPNVAVRRSNLATILYSLGEPAEARKQIELALASDLRQFGPDHPNVALDRSNLAVILRALGEPAEARKQIEPAAHARGHD